MGLLSKSGVKDQNNKADVERFTKDEKRVKVQIKTLMASTAGASKQEANAGKEVEGSKVKTLKAKDADEFKELTSKLTDAEEKEKSDKAASAEALSLIRESKKQKERETLAIVNKEVAIKKAAYEQTEAELKTVVGEAESDIASAKTMKAKQSAEKAEVKAKAKLKKHEATESQITIEKGRERLAKTELKTLEAKKSKADKEIKQDEKAEERNKMILLVAKDKVSNDAEAITRDQQEAKKENDNFNKAKELQDKANFKLSQDRKNEGQLRMLSE